MISVNSPKTKLTDWFGFTFLGAYVYVIPALPLLPTSPIALLTVMSLGMFGISMPFFFSSFRGKARMVFLALMVMFLYKMFIDLGMSSGSFLGPKTRAILISPLSFVALSLIIGRMCQTQTGLERLVKVYLVILTLSVIWFLLTSFIQELYYVHAVIYQYTMADVIRGLRSGLVANLHTFGYHLVPLTVLLISLTILSKGFKQLAVIALTGMTLLAVLMAGERSVLLGVAVGTGIVMTRPQFRNRVNFLFILLAWVLGLVAIEMNLMQMLGLAPEEILKAGTHADLLSKLDSGEYGDEGSSRLMLQWEGLQVIAAHPIGLKIAEKSWYDIMLVKNPEIFLAWGPLGTVIAVHNGYLAEALVYGWPTFFLTIFTLYHLGTIGLQLVFSNREDKRTENLDIGLGAAMLGSFFQALFHNGSYVGGDKATLIVILLCLAAYSRMKEEKNEKTPIQTIAPPPNLRRPPPRRPLRPWRPRPV